MGNKRNKRNSHLNRGKFKNGKLSNKQLKKDIANVQPNHENVSYSPLEGSRIINLQHLTLFANNVSLHSRIPFLVQAAVKLDGGSLPNILQSWWSGIGTWCSDNGQKGIHGNGENPWSLLEGDTGAEYGEGCREGKKNSN